MSLLARFLSLRRTSSDETVLLAHLLRQKRRSGHCQTNLTGPAKGADLKRPGCKLTPLGQGGRTVLLEDVAGVEVAVVVELIVDRGVDGGEFL